MAQDQSMKGFMLKTLNITCKPWISDSSVNFSQLANVQPIWHLDVNQIIFLII